MLQVAKNLEGFYAEQKAAEERKKAKSLAQKRDRDAQLREQAARAAAEERLRRLEDDELSAHLRREQEIAKERAEQKKRANEEYHRQTAKANREAKVHREAAQK